jgi:hypothetical protein
MDHIENDASNNSSLLRECVYWAVAYQWQGDIPTDPQTPLWYNTDCIENDASNNSSTVVCIHCHGKMSIKLLPSNNRGDTHTPTHRLMRGIYEVYHWDGAQVSWYTYWVSYRLVQSFKSWQVDIRTHRQHSDLISLLPFFQNKESRLKSAKFVVLDVVIKKLQCLLHIFMRANLWICIVNF